MLAVERQNTKEPVTRASGPSTVFDIKQVVAEGNLVFLHIAASRNGGIGPATGLPQSGKAPAAAVSAALRTQSDQGAVGDGLGADEMVIILRIENGKVVNA